MWLRESPAPAPATSRTQLESRASSRLRVMLYASGDRARRDRRIVNGEITIMNAEIGIVNAEIGIVNGELAEPER